MKPKVKTLKPSYEAPVITGIDLSLEADICNIVSSSQTQEFRIDDSWIWEEEFDNK
jgi:hypothetical protein